MGDYLTFWKADTAVFLRQVPTTSLFIPSGLKQSLDLLRLFCTTEAAQLLVLTGSCGTGKSTLLRWLATELPTSTHDMVTLSLVSEEQESGWLAPRLAAALGAPTTEQDPRLAMEFVARRLDELAEQKRHMIIAIDSAHLVRTAGGLQEILAILNIQTLSLRCVSFVIAGEPHLMEPLATMPGVTGKIALLISLNALTLNETGDYLAHRLRLAGMANPFETDAIWVIYERCQGVMLSTDIFAEHCLIEAAAHGSPRITAALAQSASRHLAKPLAVTSVRSQGPVESLDGARNTDESAAPSVSSKESPPSAMALDPQDRQSPTLELFTHSSLGTVADAPGPTTYIPPPPKPSPDSTASTPKPASEEISPSHPGSSSIRLSSLFKSLASPPKPKKGS